MLLRYTGQSFASLIFCPLFPTGINRIAVRVFDRMAAY
jgi:hypothetical protein